MKECAICGEELDTHAIKCSQGHSCFRSPRTVKVSKEEEQRFEAARQLREKLEIQKEQLEKQRQDSRREREAELEKQRVELEEQRVELEKQRQETRKREAELECERRERHRNSLGLIAGTSHEQVINRDDLIELLADAIDVATYGRSTLIESRGVVDYTYTDNQAFWTDALDRKLLPGMRINLQRFHMIQWLPSAPGRYYASDAVKLRERAQSYLRQRGDVEVEYIPLGKGLMVLGGVGSVRLGERSVDSEKVYPLGASSTGISHQGIPIMLTQREYRKLIPYLTEGGCLANLTGTLQIIPIGEQLIQYDRQTPKYILFVDQVKIIKSSERLLVTVAVTFSSESRDYYQYRKTDKLWSFCSFDPTRQAVNSASQWLEEYVQRYSNNGDILSDFDEHYEHFGRRNVDFPVSQIAIGNIDFDKLESYRRDLRFEVNLHIQRLIMSETFNNDFSGANIANFANKVTDNARLQANQYNYTVEQQKNLAEAAKEIHQLLAQLQNQGMTSEQAQDKVANDIANQARSNPTMRDKLLKWGQSLGDATVSDVVKGVVKLAIRSAGLPLP